MSAARSSDKVALVMFSDGIEQYIPPRKGRRHLLRLIREMLFVEPKRQGTDLSAALTFLNHVLHRRSIVFLLTDFLHTFGPVTPSAGGRPRELLQEIGMTNLRHDLVCVHLNDPLESAIPTAGLVTIEDAETGELIELDTVRSGVRDVFAQSNADRLAALDRALQHAGVDTLRLNVANPFAPALQRFFELRRGRRRG
jgi:uncharacterized protein (DUF58 family)